MIASMTAYGRSENKTDGLRICVEIKSVNSRYFDCTVRLPRAYAFLEEKIKTYVQTNLISRGKVEVSLTYEARVAADGEIRVDPVYTAAYLAALRDLRDTYHLSDDISVMRVAANPAVFTHESAAEDPEDVWQQIEPVLRAAGQSFTATRMTEGEKIGRDITDKLTYISGCTDEIEKISLADTVGYRDKLEGRLRTLLGDGGIVVDENRLLTECAMWADKIAIDEELTRLRAHFGAFRDICAEKTPCGKKLDFLMQEMNRETNTIGSKANNAAIAKLVVTVKNELEKIREQIQNIE